MASGNTVILKVPVVGLPGVTTNPPDSGPIHVCYATDGNGTQPRQLLCSLHTLLKASPDPGRLAIHILCGKGGEQSLPKQLCAPLDAFLSKVGFAGREYHDAYTPTRDLFPGLDPQKQVRHISFPTWYRLAIPELVKSSYALYMDTDTLVRGDVSSFLGLGIEKYAFMAAEDLFLPKAKAGGSLHADTFENGPALQAGVLVLNNSRMRSSGFLDRVRNAVASDVFRGVQTSDQRVLEAARNRGDCGILPKYMVFPLALVAFPSAKVSPADMFCATIWHYHGPKEQRYFNNPKLRGPFDTVYREALRFLGAS